MRNARKIINNTSITSDLMSFISIYDSIIGVGRDVTMFVPLPVSVLLCFSLSTRIECFQLKVYELVF